jgi:membrane protein DedA with SNARE-associated domain
MTGYALDLFNWFTQYGYWVIFPLILIEGPITTIVAGWFSSLGYLNLVILLVVANIADMAGDLLYYFIGRFGRQKNIIRFTKWLGFNEERLLKMEQHFEKHANRTFIIGKLTHGVGGLVLVAAGVAKFPFIRFFLYNFVPTVLKTTLLVFLGYYFGRAYNQYANFFDYLALITLTLFIILYIWYIRKNSRDLQ